MLEASVNCFLSLSGLTKEMKFFLTESLKSLKQLWNSVPKDGTLLLTTCLGTNIVENYFGMVMAISRKIN